MTAPKRASSTLAASGLLMFALSVACRSESQEQATDNASTALLDSPHVTGAASAMNTAGVWRPCAQDRECEASHVCATVGKHGDQRCALRQPADLAIVTSDSERRAHVRVNPRYMGKLLVIEQARLLSHSVCTLMACDPPDRCCNSCSEPIRVDGEGFQTDAGRLAPFVEQGGVRLACPAHDDCVSTTCPPAWGIGQPREVVGSFRDEDHFELLSPWLSLPTQ